MSLGLLKLFLIIFFLFINNSTKAEPVQKNIGLFKLLNKSTNKVSQKKIFVNESAEWGTLNIELYACFSSPPNEIPENYALISVLDKLNKEKIDYLQNEIKSIYTDDKLRALGRYFRQHMQRGKSVFEKQYQKIA